MTATLPLTQQGLDELLEDETVLRALLAEVPTDFVYLIEDHYEVSLKSIVEAYLEDRADYEAALSLSTRSD